MSAVSIIELMTMFPDEAAAAQWFERERWPGGAFCPHCGSKEVSRVVNGNPMPWRCRSCRKHFSVRSGTLMAESKLTLRTWALAIYLYATSPKGVSSTKLCKDLGVTQKTAWFLAHRIREAMKQGGLFPFAGPVEVDETYVGGRFKTMHACDRRKRRLEPNLGKSIVVGAKDQATNLVTARVVDAADADTLEGFVREVSAPDAEVFTDEAKAYSRIKRRTVQHKRGEYVAPDGAHIQGIESFWATIKRVYKGTHHYMSPKHLQRYVDELAARHGFGRMGALDRMSVIFSRAVGRRLTWGELVG